MTPAKGGLTAPVASTADAAALAKLQELLGKTTTAYDLMMHRDAPPPMLQMIRHSLGQVHLKLAENYLAAGRVQDAISSAREAHELLRDDRDAALLLARALLGAGEIDRALPILEQAVAHDPRDAGIRALLAQVYFNSGRVEDAVLHFRVVADLRPDDATLLAAFVSALTLAGELQEALSVLRRLLELVPGNVDHLYRYASLCNDTGAFDEARVAFARLIALQPGRGLNHRLFGKLHTYAPGDPHIAEMQSLLGRAGPDSADARELHFALFNAREGLKDYDLAFDHLKSANDILRGQLNYRPETFNELFANIAAAFDPQNPPDIARAHRHERPIFIVGMPRSGSTLVEQILDSHPDASGVGETPAFAALVEKRILQPDLRYDLRVLSDPWSMEAFGIDYLDAIRKGIGPGMGRRTVDKYLTNFLSIGIIKAVFPKARIVHCHRNPLANCFSVYASYFETTGLGFQADMAQTADYYVQYARLMDFWKGQFGDDILDLSYEKLTADQENETRRLLAYCGLDWHPACLDFHRNDRAVKTASYMQVRQPIYSGVDRRTANYIRHLGPMVQILQQAGLHPA